MQPVGMARRRAKRTDSAAKPAQRKDGWINALTGIGKASRDKRLNNVDFQADRLTQEWCEEVYRGDDIAARVVDTIPNEMTREGWTVRVADDKEASEAADAALDELDALAIINEALRWERAYGGAGIFIGANDGEKDLTKPLNLAKVKSLDFLTVLTARELFPERWYTDPMSPNYGRPEIYRLQPLWANAQGGGDGPFPRVHESRIIRLGGIRVSRRQTYENNGWGDSVLVRCQQVISDFGQSWAGVAILLQDFSQAIFKMKGLAELMASNDDGVVQARMQLIDLSRSIARAVMIDADGEEFERKSTSLTGLPEVLEKMMLRLAAAADMPVSLLMGQAPAGLNATGDSDIRWFYDRVAALQGHRLRPMLNRLLEVLFSAKDGPTGGQLPESWSVEFGPLWQLDELQQADVRLKTSQADKIEIEAGVVTAEEVAKSRHGGDQWSTNTVLDTEGREAMDAARLAMVGEGDPAGTGAGTSVDPKSALQGPQVLAMLQVVQAVASGQIPREAGIGILTAAFPLSSDDADVILGNAGAGFEATPKPAPVAPGQPSDPAAAPSPEPAK